MKNIFDQEQGMDETEKSDNSVLVLYFHIC